MIGPFIDMIWVGRLGPAAVAGVGIASGAITVANAAMTGLVWGVRAVVARYVGGRDWEGANHATRQAFIILGVSSVIVAVAGILLTNPILSLFQVETDVLAAGSVYLRIQFIGIVTMALRLITEGTMQASGDAMTPMKIGLIFRAVHVALCPTLVFGLGHFPQMGVAGAALTNVISQALGGIMGLWVLFTGRTGLRLSLHNFSVDLKMIGRMLRIGLPNLLTGTQHFFCVLLLTWLISPFGTLAVAAHTLWQRLDQVLVTMGMGIGASAGVLGAQNLGASKPERAVKSGWMAAGLDMVVMGIGSISFLLFADKMVGIFTSDQNLINLSATFLHISSASYLLLGLNLVFMQYLVGIGDTLNSLIMELVRAWAVQIVLAFVLSRYTSLGVYGVRWSMVAGFAFGGLIFTLYFRLGRWKRRTL